MHKTNIKWKEKYSLIIYVWSRTDWYSVGTNLCSRLNVYWFGTVFTVEFITLLRETQLRKHRDRYEVFIEIENTVKERIRSHFGYIKLDWLTKTTGYKNSNVWTNEHNVSSFFSFIYH